MNTQNTFTPTACCFCHHICAYAEVIKTHAALHSELCLCCRKAGNTTRLCNCVVEWRCRCGRVYKLVQLRKGTSLFRLYCTAQIHILISNKLLMRYCSELLSTHLGPLHHPNPTCPLSCCPSSAALTCKPYIYILLLNLPPPLPPCSPMRLIFMATTTLHHHRSSSTPFPLAVPRQISPRACPTLPYPALPLTQSLCKLIRQMPSK